MDTGGGGATQPEKASLCGCLSGTTSMGECECACAYVDVGQRVRARKSVTVWVSMSGSDSTGVGGSVWVKPCQSVCECAREGERGKGTNQNIRIF